MTKDHHRRVLVVDDDPDIRNLLVTVLQRKSLIVDVATNGDEAIDLLRQHGYGVVLLDLFMPVTDGFAVLDTIEREAWQPVVLVITGADRGTIEKLDARSIHGVVKKPFDPEDLANVVASCADIRGMRGFETMALAMMSGPFLAFLSKM
jgi:two-component system response regulator AtoC